MIGLTVTIGEEDRIQVHVIQRETVPTLVLTCEPLMIYIPARGAQREDQQGANARAHAAARARQLADDLLAAADALDPTSRLTVVRR